MLYVNAENYFSCDNFHEFLDNNIEEVGKYCLVVKFHNDLGHSFVGDAFDFDVRPGFLNPISMFIKLLNGENPFSYEEIFLLDVKGLYNEIRRIIEWRREWFVSEEFPGNCSNISLHIIMPGKDFDVNEFKKEISNE